MFGADWLDQAQDSAVAWSAVLISPFIGSFLGVVIRRLPAGKPIVWARSRCEGCGVALSIRDLVPILSWLVSGGRCRVCGRGLGLFYPAVELTALCVALVAVRLDIGVEVWLDCILGWWLLAFDPAGLTDRALGAAAGYLALHAVAFIYRRLRGRDGLGEGDAKLLAAAGAWVGASALPQVVLIAALAGLFAAGCLHLAGYRLRGTSAMPFGPFLAFATWIVWLLPAL